MKTTMMKMKLKRRFFNNFSLLILALSTCLISTSNAQNTYYVSTAGNDNNNGSYNSPWRNINPSLGKIFPGDTLEIMAGTYTGIVSNFVRSGTDGNIITIRNHNQDKVILDGNGGWTVIDFHDMSYYHFQGLEITGGVWAGINGVRYHYSKISECTIHDIGPSSGTSVGIYISDTPGGSGSATHNIIEYNTIYNIHGEGVYIGNNAYTTPPDGSPCNYNIVRYNDISFCGDGIDIKTGSKYNQIIGNRFHDGISGEYYAAILLYEESIVDRNYVYNNNNYGIWIQGNHNTISRNIIYGNNFYAIFITGEEDYWNGYKDSGDDNIIINNTVVDNNGFGMWIWAGAGKEVNNTTVKNNIFMNNTDYQFYAYPYAQSGMQMDGNNYVSSSTSLIGYNNVNYNTVESFRQATGQGAHSVSFNPGFVDAANHDYHLQNTSLLIDRGIDVGLSFRGTAPDIGAFENEGGDHIPPNSPLNLRSPDQTSNSIQLN